MCTIAEYLLVFTCNIRQLVCNDNQGCTVCTDIVHAITELPFSVNKYQQNKKVYITPVLLNCENVQFDFKSGKLVNISDECVIACYGPLSLRL